MDQGRIDGSRWQEAGNAQHGFRRDGHTTLFENAFAERGGEDEILIRLVESIQRGFGGFVFGGQSAFRLVLAHEMGDDINPFVVPGQHTRPHLVALVRLHFLPE